MTSSNKFDNFSKLQNPITQNLFYYRETCLFSYNKPDKLSYFSFVFKMSFCLHFFHSCLHFKFTSPISNCLIQKYFRQLPSRLSKIFMSITSGLNNNRRSNYLLALVKNSWININLYFWKKNIFKYIWAGYVLNINLV